MTPPVAWVLANPLKSGMLLLILLLGSGLALKSCEADKAREAAATATANAKAAQAVVKADREAARAVEPAQRRFNAEQQTIERNATDAATSDHVGAGVQSYFDGLRAAREAGGAASPGGADDVR